MTDVLMFHGQDGGNIELVSGVATVDNGVRTSIYLSLFGGNEDDDGTTSSDSNQWWGNRLESDDTRKLRGEFKAVCRSVPLTSGTLVLFEEAAARDVTWLKTSGHVDAIAVEMRITGHRRIALDVHVLMDAVKYSAEFEVVLQ